MWTTSRACRAFCLACASAALAACGSSNDSTGAASGAPPAGKVAVYLSTADLAHKLERQPDLQWSDGAGGSNDIALDPATHYQTLTTGFGVAMTDSSAWLLHEVLPAAQRDPVMRALFSPVDGIGLSYLRIGIGGTDYNHEKTGYTYDDLPSGETDLPLAHFSTARDQAYLMPMIRQALALNPAITVTAAPWSPPAWMKTDGTLVPTLPTGTLKEEAYAPLAQYFLRFVQDYAAAGIPVRQLSLQNEPYNPLLLISGIPGMFLPPQSEARLLRDYVAPAFRDAGMPMQFVIWDFFYQLSESFIPPVMELAGADVGGIAYHCYFTDERSMSTEHMLFPDVPAYETECSSYLSTIEPSQMTIRSLRNWAQGVQLWNAVLDENFGPKFGGGCKGQPGSPHAGLDCIAPVMVDSGTGAVSYTADFWSLAQFSRFIHLGARRVDSNSLSNCFGGPSPLPCGVENVAFDNSDGSRVLVATTNNGAAQTFTVTDGGRHFEFTLPDGATATFVWSAQP